MGCPAAENRQTGKARKALPLLAELHAVRRHINDRKLGTGARKLDGSRAQAAANLQHAFALNRNKPVQMLSPD
jgi:hypothetical protein